MKLITSQASHLKRATLNQQRMIALYKAYRNPQDLENALLWHRVKRTWKAIIAYNISHA